MGTFGARSRTKWQTHDIIEAIIRVLMLLLFMDLEERDPFIRKIHPEEVWLYRNPKTPSYVPGHLLWKMATFIPLITILAAFYSSRCKEDMRAAILVITMAIPLNGVITNIIKLCVGRFRPDFVFRCWPDGIIPVDAFDFEHLVCSGRHEVIAQGRKSFPSGHSSFSFATFGFVFLYFSGKAGTFHGRKERGSWRLLFSLACLLIPLAIAMSRTADYHHHWQDVVVGSALGLAIVFLVYRQYYPSILDPNSALPLSVINNSNNNNNSPGKIDQEKALLSV